MKIIHILKEKISEKILRFILTGIIALCTDYFTFFLIYSILGLNLYFANTAGLVLGFIVSFALNRIWVFENSENEYHHRLSSQIVLYLILLAINSLISYEIILLLKDRGMSPLLGKVIAIVLIAIWNYIIYKNIIFRDRK